jgi:hypothetical protein
MKADLRELQNIAKSLPAEKVAEVVDFARFLRAKSRKVRRKRANA